MNILRRIAAIAVAAASFSAMNAGAVYLDPGGLGQALIYPYFTAQSTGGNPFNTLITVVNRGADSKVIRVRFREGRNAREIASFNLYLGSQDTWTGAVIADAGGARFITADQSCVNPPFSPSVGGGTTFFEFSSANFTGAQGDGLGTGPERMREGFIEMIEMGTLPTAVAALVNPPTTCSQVQGNTVQFAANPPTGNLSGTLTLINVATGMNFTSNAVALAELSTRAFYRNYNDPYPDFTAVEIDPVSIVPSASNTSRVTWTSNVDAVASALMAASLGGETILDAATNSGTDWIVTFPMRPFRQPGGSTPPISYPRGADTGYQNGVNFQWTPRDGGATLTFLSTDLLPLPSNTFNVDLSLPWASTVVSFAHGGPAKAGPIATSTVLGSTNAEQIMIPTSAEDGVGALNLAGTMGPSTASTFDYTTATAPAQEVTFTGAPAVGFWVRTYLNGTLTCGAATCLGNYGGAYPYVVKRPL
ncbi:MAG TPA: hypothetical protein VKR38_04815 [Usitatibacter sp.]|nr:hypothetical protein [Usitatibacter sp.]